MDHRSHILSDRSARHGGASRKDWLHQVRLEGGDTSSDSLLGSGSIVCGVTPAGSNSILFIPPIAAIGAVAVHTIAHLATAALIAWVVYDFIGLAILRRSWVNLDLIWSFSLLAAGIFLFLRG